MTQMLHSQFDTASALFARVIAGRDAIGLDDARMALVKADPDGRVIESPVTPYLVARLLRRNGYECKVESPRGNRLYTRRSGLSKREAGIIAARAWRLLNKPYFDAIYGPEECGACGGAAHA